MCPALPGKLPLRLRRLAQLPAATGGPDKPRAVPRARPQAAAKDKVAVFLKYIASRPTWAPKHLALACGDLEALRAGLIEQPQGPGNAPQALASAKLADPAAALDTRARRWPAWTYCRSRAPASSCTSSAGKWLGNL